MPDYSLINNGIFIGNIQSIVGNPATKERDILDERNIHVVISALTEEEYEDYMLTKEDLPEIEWHRFVVDDEAVEPISQYFYRVHDIISNSVAENKNVIVHCAAGMSRSATLVIAYLMIENKWYFEAAYDYVKRKRPIIEPNIGFVRQLKDLEFKLRQ
jgi:protein-tyrosine phosphatase